MTYSIFKKEAQRRFHFTTGLKKGNRINSIVIWLNTNLKTWKRTLPRPLEATHSRRLYLMLKPAGWNISSYCFRNERVLPSTYSENCRACNFLVLNLRFLIHLTNPNFFLENDLNNNPYNNYFLYKNRDFKGIIAK